MRLHKLLLVLALCLFFSFVVSAHPGKTDSDGGHTNHSTGEYHYHHGYPAHQHSDIDGDGILDCPYLFDDKTVSAGDKIESPKDDPEPEQKAKSKKIKNYFLPIICCFVLYGVVLLIGELKWGFKK